jgi:hypothetical protein
LRVWRAALRAEQFSQLELEDLAGGVAGQAVDVLELLGQLAGDQARAEQVLAPSRRR